MGLYLVLSGFDGIVSIMKGISNVEYIRLYPE